MADKTTNIGGATGHLHISINPAGHALTAEQLGKYATGYSILFDEHSQKIYVGGQPYEFKTLSNAEYSAIFSTSDAGSLTSQIININNIIGTITGPNGATTVQGALGVLQSEIDALQTGVAGVSGALDAAVSTLNASISNAAEGKITSVNGLTGDTSGAVVISGSDIAWTGGVSGTGTSVADKITILTNAVSQFASGAELKLFGADGTSAADTVTVGDTFYLKQGGATIATFDIEKDSFVREGTLVYGPTGGLTNGNAPDENESTGPSAATPDPYLKLIINTSDAASGATGENYVYIPAKKLVDVYEGKTGTHINVTVDDSNNISATLNTASITGAEIATGAVDTVNIADNAVTAGKINITEATLTGLVAAGATAASGAAQAKSGATASSYVAVVNMASVSTEDAQVSGVTVGTTYADAYGAAAAVLGSSSDGTSATTVYGVKAYTDNAKTELIGDANAGADTNTINGAKAYARNAASDVVSWTIIDGETGSAGE